MAIALLVVACLEGCHFGSEDKYPVWASEPRPYSPKPESDNAFDAYAIAAVDVEAKGGDAVGKVSFYSAQKKEIADAIKDPVQKVVDATSKPCTFQFVPHKPFQPAAYQAGWRLIGRVILWRVDDACQVSDYDKAIPAAIAGTKFGFDLSGGGATDVSLGLSIVDDIRRTIAPHLIHMSPTQLDRLGKGVMAALNAKPATSISIKNENENALQSLQYLQNSLQLGRLKDVLTNLGPDVNEAVKYLEPLAGNAGKRNAYFRSLAAAADAEFKKVLQDSEIPASARINPPAKITEPWKKFAKHIFGGERPTLDMTDATVARTRLLVLYSQITRLGLRKKSFPKDLSKFTEAVTIDPYSGNPFIYRTDQSQFSLYSVGSNGKDDGGDTDSTFTFPDLRLECPIQ